MEETKNVSYDGKQEEKNLSYSGFMENEKSLLDFEDSDFENLESNASNVNASDNNPKKENDDLIGNLQSFGLASTTRPLVTGNEEEISSLNTTSNLGNPNLCDYLSNDKTPSLIDIGDKCVETLPRESSPSFRSSDGDHLLIEESRQVGDADLKRSKTPPTINLASISSSYVENDIEIKERFPEAAEPKISPKGKAESENYESGFSAYDSFAHHDPVKSKTAMEAEMVGNATKNCEVECPFSPGAWFNPEKLHPVVADYVYWRDPKKSGIAFGASLVLLLSLKYFSFISVVAYLTLALLSVTVSFRIYKNVLQAVQKSNEGHPFKEYLDMDIALSQEKVNGTVETLIHHINCVTTKLRSLILVEDLVDTLKLGILAWCLTYIGAWFNGMTLIIITLVAAFTLPKIYDTNKTQIDAYTEIMRTKGKEIIDMVNAKMPMCKKKKEQ